MVLCDYMDVRSGVNLIFSAYVTWGGGGVFVFFVSAWREESCLAGSRREEIKLSLREVKNHKFSFKVCERLFLSFSVSLLGSLTGIFL